MKKAIISAMAVISVFAFMPSAAQAFTARSGDTVYIGPEETVEGSLYAAGTAITVEGKISGDLICAAESVSIKGTVEGSVICAARTINMDGDIAESARLLAQSASVNGTVNGNLNAFGGNLLISSGGSVGKEALVAGETVEVRGRVGSDLHGAAARMTIAGDVGGNVQMRLDERDNRSLTVENQASIGGNLFYTAGQKAQISEQAEITGEIRHTLTEAKPDRNWMGKSFGSIYSIFAALVVGLVLASIGRRQIRELTDIMIGRISASLLAGFAVFFLVPIACLLLLFTIIGLPLAIIIFLLLLIAMYVGKILTGILVGRSIIEKFWTGKKDSMIWSMILGIVIFWILGGIPVLGWLISLFGIFWGLGGMWLYAKASR